MDFFSGYTFFVYLTILLVPAVIMGIKELPLRHYRMMLTVFFIYKVFEADIEQLMYLIFYILVSILLIKSYLFLRDKQGRNQRIFFLYVFLAILPLVVYKISAMFNQGIFGFLGLSYLCFRVEQIIIETYDGVIKEIGTYSLIQFLLFFPALSSGPIDRSRRFFGDDLKIYEREEYIELLTIGLYRFIQGLFYKIVCSGILNIILQNYLNFNNRLVYMLVYAYVYGIYLFFDFAGYSSMAIGISYMLGIKMPENFDKPFISVDMKDFWNRWHITLSHWFRDFIFTRLLIDFLRKKTFKDRVDAAAVALIINMFIMGVWHGLEKNYILYGLYHGFLLAGTEVFQKKSTFYKKNKNKKLYRGISWFLTINMVMFGFLIFSGRTF